MRTLRAPLEGRCLCLRSFPVHVWASSSGFAKAKVIQSKDTILESAKARVHGDSLCSASILTRIQYTSVHTHIACTVSSDASTVCLFSSSSESPTLAKFSWASHNEMASGDLNSGDCFPPTELRSAGQVRMVNKWIPVALFRIHFLKLRFAGARSHLGSGRIGDSGAKRDVLLASRLHLVALEPVRANDDDVWVMQNGGSFSFEFGARRRAGAIGAMDILLVLVRRQVKDEEEDEA